LAEDFSGMVKVGNFSLTSRPVIAVSSLRVVPPRIVDYFEHLVVSIGSLECVGLRRRPVFVLDYGAIQFHLALIERAVRESQGVGDRLAAGISLNEPIGVRLPIFGCRLAAQTNCWSSAFVDGLSYR